MVSLITDTSLVTAVALFISCRISENAAYSQLSTAFLTSPDQRIESRIVIGTGQALRGLFKTIKGLCQMLNASAMSWCRKSLEPAMILKHKLNFYLCT